MTKVQTRRCVSLSRPIYEAFKAYCLENKQSMASVVESLVTEMLRGVCRAPEALPKKEASAMLGWEKALRERQAKEAKPDARGPGNVKSF